jgi:hypothetical protein
MVAALLKNAQEGIEHRRDMVGQNCRIEQFIRKTYKQMGREPAAYANLRNTPMVLQMLHDARTLDAYAKVCIIMHLSICLQ